MKMQGLCSTFITNFKKVTAEHDQAWGLSESRAKWTMPMKLILPVAHIIPQEAFPLNHNPQESTHRLGPPTWRWGEKRE